jgi:hypothetical protein
VVAPKSAPPSVDPSENVKALNEASIAGLRREITLEVAGLRREIQNQAELVDKTREIDRQNQTLIDERLQAGTEKLAATIELTAKTFSGSAAETAKSLATQMEATFGRLADRVATLERGQYEGAGQAGVRDPQLAALMAEVAALRLEQTKETGQSAGLSMGVKVLIGALSLMATLLGAVATALGIAAYFAK